jgi:hypothetical protein
MKSRCAEDTAPYAADCLASAQVNAPRLLASSALFVVLLAAMTFIETPVACNDLRTHVARDPQSTSSVLAAAANSGRAFTADSALRCPGQHRDNHARS